MAYIFGPDLLKSIQDINLQQIINSDQSILTNAVLAGEAEAKSYLRQKYDLEKEFKDTPLFNIQKIYFAGERYYLNASAYASGGTYNINQLTTYNNVVYICTSATDNPAGPFDPTKWTLLGQVFSLFFAKYPADEFDYSALYNVGDQVFWKNKIYTCKIQTAVLSHDTGLQYRTYKNLPTPNPAPDDPVNGLTYWGVGVPYQVNAGTLPTDTSKYTKADNRDQQMVLYLVDVILYHIHSRITPRNIPDIRVKRYDDSIAWFRKCANGELTPALPLLKPNQGNRIRYGSNIKQINTY